MFELFKVEYEKFEIYVLSFMREHYLLMYSSIEEKDEYYRKITLTNEKFEKISDIAWLFAKLYLTELEYDIEENNSYIMFSRKIEVFNNGMVYSYNKKNKKSVLINIYDNKQTSLKLCINGIFTKSQSILNIESLKYEKTEQSCSLSIYNLFSIIKDYAIKYNINKMQLFDLAYIVLNDNKNELYWYILYLFRNPKEYSIYYKFGFVTHYNDSEVFHCFLNYLEKKIIKYKIENEYDLFSNGYTLQSRFKKKQNMETYKTDLINFESEYKKFNGFILENINLFKNEMLSPKYRELKSLEEKQLFLQTLVSKDAFFNNIIDIEYKYLESLKARKTPIHKDLYIVWDNLNITYLDCETEILQTRLDKILRLKYYKYKNKYINYKNIKYNNN
jgi:hypothetical protein